MIAMDLSIAYRYIYMHKIFFESSCMCVYVIGKLDATYGVLMISAINILLLKINFSALIVIVISSPEIDVMMRLILLQCNANSINKILWELFFHLHIGEMIKCMGAEYALRGFWRALTTIIIINWFRHKFIIMDIRFFPLPLPTQFVDYYAVVDESFWISFRWRQIIKLTCCS